MMRLLLVAALAVNSVAGFATLRPSLGVGRIQVSALHVTTTDAIAAFDASQAQSIQSFSAAIPDLSPKPDSSWSAGSGVVIAGSPAKLDAWDAPGPANVAWISSLCVSGLLSSLTIYNGPLTDVPHLVSQCVVVGDSLVFTLDFRPRAYGAYETRRPDGSYPGPDELGRKAFEFSGARKDFDSKFGTEEVVSFMAATAASFEGGIPNDAVRTEVDVLVRGPLYLSMTMPLTDGNVAAVIAARERAASYWLSWALDNSHEHRPGAPVNTQYVYDSKFKINAYTSLLSQYVEVFGEADGAKLAAADSGPLDEAYVGGGS